MSGGAAQDRAHRSGVLGVLASSQRRGAEVFAVELRAALAGRGVDVRNVALVRGGRTDGVAVDVLGEKALAPSSLAALRREAVRRRGVVAHGSRTLPACAAALIGARTPFVYRAIGDPGYWSAGALRRGRTALLLTRATVVVALWPGAAATLARLHGVPQRKLWVIPNGAPAERFAPADPARRSASREALGLAGDVPVIVYLGALSPEKRVDIAIQAMSRLSDAWLLVCGEGPERHRLEALARDSAPGRVRFAGQVADPSAILAAADTVVLPSRTEGMPGALIEAGLSGVPAVATAVGGVSEVVVDGETGRLVPAGDATALAGALEDVLARHEALGHQARRHCLARFEIGVVAARWHDLLSELPGG